MTHPDLCPYCRAPISEEQRERIDERLNAERRPCTCPVGFGQGQDPRCPRHGVAASVAASAIARLQETIDEVTGRAR